MKVNHTKDAKKSSWLKLYGMLKMVIQEQDFFDTFSDCAAEILNPNWQKQKKYVENIMGPIFFLDIIQSVQRGEGAETM